MTPEPGTVKSCCAAAYESEIARALLGDSFHPGGLDLTQRLGELLALGPGLRVLDVASGKGASAIFLAQKFGCEVVGIDIGAANITEAERRADAAGVAGLVTFEQADAESMSFPDGAFDRLICECAFCTFPNKAAAAAEFARVLRSAKGAVPRRDTAQELTNGRRGTRPVLREFPKAHGGIGLSDITRSGELPAELEGMLAWLACIADARPVGEYTACLKGASFEGISVEVHDDALLAMARDVQARLLGLELMGGLKKLDFAGTDFAEGKKFARAAMKAIKDGILGYALITGEIRC